MKKQKSNKHIRPKAYRRAVQKNTLRYQDMIGQGAIWYGGGYNQFDYCLQEREMPDDTCHCSIPWQTCYYCDHKCLKISRLYKATGWTDGWKSYKESM